MEPESTTTRIGPAGPTPRGAQKAAGWWALARDLGLGLGLAVVAGLWLTVTPGAGAGREIQLALAALAVAGAMLSRRWPVLGVAVAGAATLAGWTLDLTADPFILTGFAVFVCAERRGTRRIPWWLASAVGVVLLASLGLGAEGSEDRFRGMLLSAVVLTASWALGVRTGQVRRESAARSRAEERLRLARDVHDVLSHSLGAIGVRAGVAAHVATLGEAELRGVLREIEFGARGSLTELKALLGRERSAEAEGMPPSLPLSAVLADIAASAERTGIRSQLDLAGDLDGLLPVPRSTVHRLVQEAVSNVIRHSAASSVSISVRVSAGAVQVEVRDDGRGAPKALRDGHGMTGMRERAALAGGSLDIATGAHGFTVSASIPLRAPAASGGASWG